ALASYVQVMWVGRGRGPEPGPGILLKSSTRTPPVWRRFWLNSAAIPVTWLAYGLPGVGVAAESAGVKRTRSSFPLRNWSEPPVFDQAWIVLARSKNRGAPTVYWPTHRAVKIWRWISRGVGVIGVGELGP